MKKIIIISSSVVILIISLFIVTKLTSINREREVILNKINQLNQLVTAKQVYKEVLYSKKSSDILWMPIVNREFLISVDYIITAGIDLKKGYNIEKKDGIYILTLPRGEIFSIDADDSSLKEYFIKERFSKLKRDDFFKLINDEKENIYNSSNSSDIIENCEYNAGRLLTSLLQLSGIKAEIKFSNSLKEIE